MAKKPPASTSDFGAQRLQENRGDFRKEGFVRSVDGAFVAFEERGGGAGLAKRARVVTQSVTDRYYFANPPQITWRQYEAANMIRSIWVRGRLDGIRTTNLEGLSGGRPAMTDHMMEARARYNEMKKALGELEKVIYWVVIVNLSARDFGQQEGLGRTDGMGILRFSLTALANHFRLPERND